MRCRSQPGCQLSERLGSKPIVLRKHSVVHVNQHRYQRSDTKLLPRIWMRLRLWRCPETWFSLAVYLSHPRSEAEVVVEQNQTNGQKQAHAHRMIPILG